MLISPVHDLKSILGYEPTRPKDFGYDEEEEFHKLHSMPDEAWTVNYVSMLGESIILYVVWSWDFDQFFLYRSGEQVNAPDHLPEWSAMLRKKLEASE